MSNLFAFWSISESPANGSYVLNPAVTHSIAYNMRINTNRTVSLVHFGLDGVYQYVEPMAAYVVSLL